MDIIPFEYDPVQLTPTQFEQEVRRVLAQLGQPLLKFEALHNQVLERPDGDYQIDVLVTFEVLHAEFRVLVECKKHGRPVEREVVQLLFEKLRATGAQKGMVFSTAGFQSGAMRFAREHSIALFHVMDGRAVVMQKSLGRPVQLPPWAPPYATRLTWSAETENGESFFTATVGPDREIISDFFGLSSAEAKEST